MVNKMYTLKELRRTRLSLIVLMRYVGRKVTQEQINMESYFSEWELLSSENIDLKHVEEIYELDSISYGEFAKLIQSEVTTACGSAACMLGWATQCLPVLDWMMAKTSVDRIDIDLDCFGEYYFPALYMVSCTHGIRSVVWNHRGVQCFSATQSNVKEDCIQRLQDVDADLKRLALEYTA